MGVTLTKSNSKFPQNNIVPREEIEESYLCEKRKTDLPHCKIIDHKSFLLQDSFSHIKGIKVCFEKYIIGLCVSYWLKSQIKMAELMGTDSYTKEDCMIFEEDEYIDYIICYYDDLALTCLKIYTTEGRTKSFGSCQKEHYKFILNLKDEGRCVIGFKGVVGNCLSKLWVYHEELDYVPGEATPSTIILDE